MAKFAYTVCPNIIKRFSFNSLQHTESYDFPIAAILGIGHFEDCYKMLYFLNTLVYRYETRYVSSGPCPEGSQKGSPIIMKF